MNSSRFGSQLTRQVVEVHRGDRWRVQQRLQELAIPAWCDTDGHLRVAVNSGLDMQQVRSVVQQFRASRAELVSWLERCWQEPIGA
jgi:hypothetical protein